MKTTIEGLLSEKKELQKRLTQVNEAIRALQAVCSHEWKYVGHDSHKDHYECAICGDTKSY